MLTAPEMVHSLHYRERMGGPNVDDAQNGPFSTLQGANGRP